MAAILYLKEDLTDLEDDWYAHLMLGVSKFLRERRTSVLSIVAGQHQKTSSQADDLADILEIENSDLPWIYLIHGLSGQLVPYPNPLDDPLDISPEIMVLWARITSISLEMPML
jgi:hypothetical protein